MSELGDRIRSEANIASRPGQYATLTAIAEEVEAVEARTLGFIDQTLYANGDSSDAVTWRNAEVLSLLREIRATLTGADHE